MSPRATLLTLFAVLSLLALGAPPARPTPVSAAGYGRNSLISYAPGRLPSGYPNTYSTGWGAALPDISADGERIVFATNLGLLPQDTNKLTDIYVYDRPTRTFILASPDPDGNAVGVDGVSFNMISHISPDGNYVTYSTASSRLVPGDTNPQADVFLFDVANRKVSLVSQSYDGTPLSKSAVLPDVTHVAGGPTLVVFSSEAHNLVAGDGNNLSDVFVRNMDIGVTSRVSVDPLGQDALGPSGQPSISRDGQWAAFYSRANNLVAGDINGRGDIFLRRLSGGLTINVTAGANEESQWPSISGDGSRVVFRSMASNLVADRNATADVFVYTQGGSIERVSVSSTGDEGNATSGGWNQSSSAPAISHDGRFVTFPSLASNLVADDTNQATDSFIRDLRNGTTERLSLASGGEQTGGTTSTAPVADGGRLAAFHGAPNFSPMLIRQFLGVFLRDRNAWPTPPIVTIDNVGPTPLLQVSQSKLHLAGHADDTDGDFNSSMVGYAWLSHLDGVVAQQANVELDATSLTAGQHNFTFVVIDDDGEATVAGPRSAVITAPGADQIRTLIVTSSERLRRTYPGDGNVEALLARLLQLTKDSQVRGVLIDVSADPQTLAAYRQWDSSPSTVQANAVVERIKGLIDQRWGGATALEHLLIVGDDRIIPFRRVPDRVPTELPGWPTEAAYGDDYGIPTTTSLGRALRDNQILTDDYYAYNTNRIAAENANQLPYFVPELGVGRLVETPAEMLASVSAFLAGSTVSIGHMGVSAQVGDFLDDLGQAECDLGALDGLTVDCSMRTASWTSDAFRANLLGAGVRNELLAFEHHANHLGFGVKRSDNTWDMVNSDQFVAAGANLQGAMLVTVGCHAGLSVPPFRAGLDLDLPQAIQQRQATYLASTGYGIGCWGCLSHTEELINNFDHELLGGEAATPGQALMHAKQSYYLAHWRQDDDPLRQKASLQLTLYGLPMYRYTSPARATGQSAGDGVSTQMASQVLASGLTVNSYTYRFPPLDKVSTPVGVYYALNGQTMAEQAEAVQPRYLSDLSFPGTEAHGVVFRGGRYTPMANFDPVVASAYNEYVAVKEPALTSPIWWPAVPARLTTFAGSTNLVALLGQYQGASRTERVFQSVALDVYYHPDKTDRAAPSITDLSGALGNGTVTLRVAAADAAGVSAVVVAYTDGAGSWSSAELALRDGVWSGQIPTGATTRFFVQAVDGVGNVAVIDNGGLYYDPGNIAFAPTDTYLPFVRR